MRALAQRSAEAAKEIRTLISTSSQPVMPGVDLVKKTGDALRRIVTEVAELNGIVSDIATNTQEQASALRGVRTAIHQMDQVTQQNVALVEETTAASKTVAQETEELARLIGRFQFGESATVIDPISLGPEGIGEPDRHGTETDRARWSGSPAEVLRAKLGGDLVFLGCFVVKRPCLVSRGPWRRIRSARGAARRQMLESSGP